MKVLKWAAAAAFIFLAGCTSMQLQNAQQTAQQLQAPVTKVCQVAQPLIASLRLSAATDSDTLDKAAKSVDQVCNDTASIDTSSVRGLANTGVPLLIQLAQDSGLADDQKKSVTMVLTAGQLLINALLPAPDPAMAAPQ